MARLASLLLVLLALQGCYRFVGGGLPSHIRTVAVLPLENDTPEPLIDTDVEQALQAELPRRLGLRLADEERAHALVRGRITQYGEAPVSVRPTDQADQVAVVQREVRIVYDLEIYDPNEDRLLWRASSQSVVGNFLPDNGETALDGKARAIRELVNKVVEGAQSQW